MFEFSAETGRTGHGHGLQRGFLNFPDIRFIVSHCGSG
jgi:hypothetical protein